MSPVEVSVPLTTRSALMIEGAAPRPGRLAGAGGGAIMVAAGSWSFGLLENMRACLYEIAGIAHDVVEQDFVMDMRPGGTAGGPDPAQSRPLGDLRPQFDTD